jgi:salicylate biosynthesis isochorismate synthase
MSMIRFFQGSITAAPSRAGVTLLVARAPVVAIDRLLASGRVSGPILVWDPPTAPFGQAESFLGWGEAARIEASGDGRFEQLRRGGDALFSTLAERRDPDLTAAPSPRLFGGVAFRPEPVRAAPWSAFADASFVIPRWRYAVSGEEASLALALGPGERADLADIERVVTALLAAHAVESVPYSADGGRGMDPRAPSARLERTSPAEWEAMIVDALASIRAHELEKVVPMTLCRVTAASDLGVASALARVRAAYPECTRFAFQRGPAVFLGASPERLVARSGAAVLSEALAGSRARAEGPRDDARAVEALLGSDKDIREHHVVVRAIERALRPFASEVRTREVPLVRTLRNVHHLWTPIEATLAAPAHVLDLCRVLHPTPAVCGNPRPAAFDWIDAHERASRGWYAGAVGWFDAAGDGAFSVAIRAGVLERREAWLYAGAGIVEGSDPAAEYEETRVKQTVMLSALGLDALAPIVEPADPSADHGESRLRAPALESAGLGS